MEVILIGDPRIESIPVEESGDQMVDLSLEYPETSFDKNREFVQKISSSISFGRKTIGRMLIEAEAQLPSGFKFLIKECYRPLSVQRNFWESYEAFLRKQNPDWSLSEIYLECSKYIAPLSVAPHSTGGAVDLLLTDQNGNWLDMGCRFNAEPTSCEYKTYFHSDKISSQARRNREILGAVMTRVGFVNYPTEWWHWSYGDKYWAYMTNAKTAIFSSLELEE